jgi:hypothetical protein
MNLDKLRKVKALAESGGMEAKAAQAMLEKLLALHKVSEKELDQKTPKLRDIVYSRNWQKRLWLLLIEYVTDVENLTYGQRNRYITVNISDADFFAAETLYNVHSPHVKATYEALQKKHKDKVKELNAILKNLEYVADGYAMKNEFYIYGKADSPQPKKPTPNGIEQAALSGYYESPTVYAPKALIEG